MSEFRFKVISRDPKSHAKTGIIHTSHGIIRTPAFVPVGSSAAVKSLTPEEIKACQIDVFFVNTYHMIFRPGMKTVKKWGSLHHFMNWPFPIMTDSAGFQVFSLGDYGPRNNVANPKQLIKINDQGVEFKSIWDGKTVFLGPKESILAQQTLGSDIMMSFDECTFYPIKKSRAKKAMERTHRWAQSCLMQHRKSKRGQALYGIIQGAVFADLRKISARFISRLPFEGIAIGSVANSHEPRRKVFSVLDWTMPIILPFIKPVHFLGIGEVEDIFLSIEKGVDSLDCVTPTRMGRMGWVFHQKAGMKNKFRFDITKSIYALDKSPIDNQCMCFTCRNFSRGYINHLFRTRELLSYRLTTIHNLFFFGSLMEKIRTKIHDRKFGELKNEWLR